VLVVSSSVCAHALGEMVVSCIPLYSLHLALICFSQKFAKGGDCWVFVLAALLLKQISLMCKLEPMFQHVVRHLCKMLDTMFQHPIYTRTLYCLRNNISLSY